MKKLAIFFIFAAIHQTVLSQVLFTYGNNTVTKDEFLRAYNKNKTVVSDKTIALREYLDLYVRFKLKVKAAKDLHLDTLASLASELQNFRAQIEESYLNDESQVSRLIDEGFLRSQKDIHVSYAFFPSKDFKDSASVEQAIKQGKEKWVDVGFITAFNMPYEFENIVYSLRPSEQSKPFRGKNGYYIFRNIEERKPVGKIKVAQILLAVPEGAAEQDRASVKKLADSLYAALLAGADFAGLAKKFSNDQMSFMYGGQLPEFGVGKFDPEFENKVFAIAKDGEIAPPFLTKHGYHIIKRLSVSPVPEDKTNDNFMYSVKQLVMQDNRIVLARDRFVNDLLKKLHYKNLPVNSTDLYRYTDSLLFAGRKITITGFSPAANLFTLNNKFYKVSDWISFVKGYRAANPSSLESNDEIMKKFISKTALDIYKKRLPEMNPEFRYQLQEFKEGNMLFEVMERNVWNKASADTNGLKEYYKRYGSKYTWAESADAIMISASNEKMANDVAVQLKTGKDWRKLAEESMAQVQADSGRYELNQLPVPAGTKFTEGLITTPLVNNNDGTATFIKVITLYPAGTQRTFDEARGLVINDYQGYLEEKWIELLKKKYPVKVNEKIFQSILSSN